MLQKMIWKWKCNQALNSVGFGVLITLDTTKQKSELCSFSHPRVSSSRTKLESDTTPLLC